MKTQKLSDKQDFNPYNNKCNNPVRRLFGNSFTVINSKQIYFPKLNFILLVSDFISPSSGTKNNTKTTIINNNAYAKQ